jgi:hypothetical protein
MILSLGSDSFAVIDAAGGQKFHNHLCEVDEFSGSPLS